MTVVLTLKTNSPLNKTLGAKTEIFNFKTCLNANTPKNVVFLQLFVACSTVPLANVCLTVYAKFKFKPKAGLEKKAEEF